MNSPSEHIKDDRRFSEVLHHVRERAAHGPLNLRELVELFGPKGHVLLTIFLVLPFLQPIPLPGVSTVFGVTISLIGFFMLINRPPWLPMRLARTSVDRETLLRVCSALEKLMKRLEVLVRPRGQMAFKRPWLRRLNGALLCVHALMVALPLPIPFSNFLPALVLLLISLGSLEEDLLFIAIGYVTILINAAFFTALFLLPTLGLRLLDF